MENVHLVILIVRFVLMARQALANYVLVDYTSKIQVVYQPVVMGNIKMTIPENVKHVIKIAQLVIIHSFV